MINAIDVLRVLESFKALKAHDDIPLDTKRRITGELLTLVPQEIMAPGAKVTSETVRNLLKAYVTDESRTDEHRRAAEAKARKAPEEPTASREAQEAGVGPQEVASIGEPMSPEVHEEVAGAGDRHRVEKSAQGTLGRPGVAGEEARGHEKRKGQGKAARRP